MRSIIALSTSSIGCKDGCFDSFDGADGILVLVVFSSMSKSTLNFLSRNIFLFSF